ncbi:hypothetical protein [Mesorhizobium delmotii]|uniref:hypothetical protein n=1 Tax=Mesorhizobium delmotii TaxID=1631247 RepID=UPI0014025D40|nr:hypothetical protein [Mesorhizobium delmotii]
MLYGATTTSSTAAPKTSSAKDFLEGGKLSVESATVVNSLTLEPSRVRWQANQK